MITAEILSNGTLSYPVFKPNQVLTEAHLNKMVKFLEGQTLISRVNLIGTGVVCGFVPTLKDDRMLISAGSGVTTEGYLISEPAVELEYYGKAFFDPRYNHSSLMLPEGNGLDAEKKIIYELFTQEEYLKNLRIISQRVEQGTVKLFSEALSVDNGGQPLTELIGGLVPVLYLEIQEYENDPCENSCDEAGGQRDFILRRLLMNPEYLNELLKTGLGISDDAALENALYGKFHLPEINVRRFGYTDDPHVKLEDIDSLELFADRFRLVFTQADQTGSSLFEVIENAYEAASNVFATYFTREEDAVSFPNLASQLETMMANYMPDDVADTGELPSGQKLGIQYFYDFLCDLIDAYQEFREVAFDLMEDCLPPKERFPRHLMLGEFLPESDCKPLKYRHHFTQPPIYNGNADRAKEVSLLFERMKRLAKPPQFSFPQPTAKDIKISPSQGPDAPLSRRAVPYYYGPEPDVHRVWSHEWNRKCRRDLQPAYFAGDPLVSHPNSLLTNLNRYPFFRIEGHFGKTFETALDSLKKQIEYYNLPFDVIAVKLGKIVEDENTQYDFYFDDLEALFVKLREDLLYALDEFDQPIDTGIIDLRGFLNKYEATGEGLALFATDDEFSDFTNLYHAIFPTGAQIPNDCSYEVFEKLVATYNERKQKISEQFLFHNYAKAHPGLEHLAGVYKGGTFVLVYTTREELEGDAELVRDIAERVRNLYNISFAEAQIAKMQAGNGLLGMISFISGADAKREIKLAAIQYVFGVVNVQTNTVIADFSLPYRCCANTPAFNYIIKKSPPVLMLVPDSFCFNDNESYEFVAVPQGGRIFGPGTREEAGERYFFRPSDAVSPGDLPLEEELTIEVGYEYDGAITQLFLVLRPLPLVGFSLATEIICVNNDAVEIVPDTGVTPATFTAWLGTEEIGGILLNPTDNKYYFNQIILADRIGVEQEEIVTIHHHRINENGCEDETTRELLVRGPRDASFTIDEGYVFCSNRQEPVELSPVHALNDDSYFRAALAEGGDLGDAIEGNLFYPNRVPLATGDTAIKVLIRYFYSDGICQSVTDPPVEVTIEVLQDASFRIQEDENNNNRLCVNLGLVTPTPVTAYSTFQIFRGDADMSGEMLTTGNQIDLMPLLEYMDGREIAIRVLHIIEGPGACRSEFPLDLIILPAPVAEVEIRDAEGEIVENICLPFEEGVTIPLTIHSEAAPGMAESYIVAASSGMDVNVENNVIQIDESLFAEGNEVTLTLTYTIDNQEGCAATVSREVKVSRPPQPSFEAVLSPEEDNEYFRVALSNIQPENGERYVLRATFSRPDGEGSVVEEVFTLDNPELVFPYAYSVPDAFVGLQLIVQRLGCEGESGLIRLEIPRPFDSDDSDADRGLLNIRGIAPAAESGLDLLRSRASAQKSELEELGQTRNLTATKAYGLSSVFLSFMGAVDALTARYEEATATILANIKRAKEDRKEDYRQLLNIVTRNYLDKLVAAGPVEVPEEAREALKVAVAQAKEAGMDMAQLRKDWNGAELKKSLEAAAVDKYNRLLR